MALWGCSATIWTIDYYYTHYIDCHFGCSAVVEKGHICHPVCFSQSGAEAGQVCKKSGLWNQPARLFSLLLCSYLFSAVPPLTASVSSLYNGNNHHTYPTELFTKVYVCVNTCKTCRLVPGVWQLFCNFSCYYYCYSSFYI